MNIPTKVLVGGGMVTSLLIGSGWGYLAADGQPDVRIEAAAPSEVVTERVEVAVPGPERVVEVPGPERTVTVPTTPEACLRALDLADQGLTLAGEGMGHAAAGFTAISQYDAEALEDATAGMRRTTTKIRAVTPEYHQTRDECRASSAEGGAA